jgi:hypothetical protein
MVLTASTTINGARTILGIFDASGASHTLSFKVVANTGALPASGCAVGEMAVVTAATLGQQIYQNSGAGTCVWTQQVNTGSSNGGGITVYSGTGLTLSGTLYFPIGGGATPSSTETNVDVDSPSAATVTNMYIQLSVALGMGNSGVFTFRKNATSQSLTCTITGASATTCSDTAHSFNVSQGDLLTVQAVFSGTIVVTPNVILAEQFGTSQSGGTVNSGTIGQCAYYAANGTAVSGQACGSGGSGLTYCVDATGSTTTYTCTPSPALGSYTSGAIVTFVPQASNTAASTINVSSLGAKTIIAANTTGATLVANDIIAGGVYTLEYDGTNFRKISGPDTAWTGLSYSNSWGDFGSGNQVGQFKKDNFGNVCIRGLLTLGTLTAGTTMVTLPAGYRPASVQVAFGIDATRTPDEFNITTAGVLQYEGSASASTAFFFEANTCFTVYP